MALLGYILGYISADLTYFGYLNLILTPFCPLYCVGNPDYQSLLDAKAKKDFELAALLDDNENLMATITTINADNKERVCIGI